MERRTFLKTGAFSAAATGPFVGKILGANDRVVVGQIGLGARGYYELTTCLGNSGVQIAAVCDAYKPLVDHAVGKVGGAAQGYADFRRVLDRKDIDAVFVSTPDHWHAPISIMACQAGKDVYCEKPLTHRVVEGRRMVEAARKYKRVVQTGSQQRSAPHFAKVRELIQSGYIGKVSRIECWNVNNQYPEGFGKPPNEDPPAGLDWDMYLGPAPKVPYNRTRFIWHYRWYWDYSGGMMTDWGAHHLDSIHHIMGVDALFAVTTAGGRLLEDDRDTPDWFRAVFEYPDFAVSYLHSAVNGSFAERRQYGTMFHGTLGTLFIDRKGYEVVPEMRAEPLSPTEDVPAQLLRNRLAVEKPATPRSVSKPRCEPIKVTGISLDPEIQEVHVQNFLDCVRSRKLTVADWELGHRSVTACHLGVIAFRTGRKIRWDSKAERIIGDTEAERLLTKNYRSPWNLPRV